MVSIQRVAGTDNADGKSRVLVIYTGGTCGMVRSPEDGSLVPSPAYLSKALMTMVSEQGEAFPNISIHEFESLIDSSDMGPDDWVAIAREIERHYYLFDGFVVLTGTDTMAYAASSLSFMFENLGEFEFAWFNLGARLGRSRFAKLSLERFIFFDVDLLTVCICEESSCVIR